LIDDGGQKLNDASNQAAVGTVKVWTSAGLASGCQAEDFGGLSGSRHGEDIWRGEQRLVEVCDLRSAGSLLNDSEHTDAFYLRL
jgi:hypothetical protein